MSPQGQKMSDMPILVGSSGPHQYIKTCPPSHTHTHSSFMSHVLHYCDSGSHRKNLHQFPHKSTPLPQLPFSQVCVCCSTEGTAPPHMPDVWRLCLHALLYVPWQQDVCVQELLHGLIQSPQVHSMQRERPSTVSQLLP